MSNGFRSALFLLLDSHLITTARNGSSCCQSFVTSLGQMKRAIRSVPGVQVGFNWVVENERQLAIHIVSHESRDMSCFSAMPCEGEGFSTTGMGNFAIFAWLYIYIFTGFGAQLYRLLLLGRGFAQYFPTLPRCHPRCHIYPLVNVYIAMENHHFYWEFIHYCN